MRTTRSVMEQMTDIKTIMQSVRDTLRVIDSAYPAEEAKYLHTVSKLEKSLRDTISPSVSEFLAALEQEFVSGMICVGWLGFKLRHDCYYNPTASLLLKQDYEDILHEGRLHSLPMSQKARQTIAAFYRQDAVCKAVGLEDIFDYYAYLHTIGYKLAHYFGFRLADGLLYYLIPGYNGDSILSAQYAADLKNYLNMDIEDL